MDASQISPAATTDNSTNSPWTVVKRPPKDDEIFDPEKAAPKRQVTASRNPGSDHTTSMSPHALYEATTMVPQPQLQEKSPADLVIMIQRMQTSHAQQVAELQDQYAAVKNQFDQLKSLFNTHFSSQLESLQLLQSKIASISTSRPASQSAIIPPSIHSHDSSALPRLASKPTSLSVLPWGTGNTSTPAPHYTQAIHTPQRQFSGSAPSVTTNSSSFGNATPSQASILKPEVKITPSSVANEAPIVEPSRIDTVPEAWEEFRYGRAGNMSLEKLDARWGPRWHQDPKIRIWYQRRKVISDRIKLYMADGVNEQDAVMEVQRMRRGRTLNWVSRILLDDKRETKKQRKVAAQAATAAMEALHSMPSA